MKWLKSLITQVIAKQLKEAGFGPSDLLELQLLIQERRRLRAQSEDTANRFITRLKEMAEGQ